MIRYIVVVRYSAKDWESMYMEHTTEVDATDDMNTNDIRRVVEGMYPKIKGWHRNIITLLREDEIEWEITEEEM